MVADSSLIGLVGALFGILIGQGSERLQTAPLTSVYPSIEVKPVDCTCHCVATAPENSSFNLTLWFSVGVGALLLFALGFATGFCCRRGESKAAAAAQGNTPRGGRGVYRGALGDQ